jgi:hypothetical protein
MAGLRPGHPRLPYLSAARCMMCWSWIDSSRKREALTISCPGPGIASLRRCKAGPGQKIAKTTPCKVEWTPVRSTLAALRPGQEKKGPNLISSRSKTWMPGTRPGVTNFATETDFIGCFLSQALRCRRTCDGLEGWAACTHLRILRGAPKTAGLTDELRSSRG